MPEVYTDGVEDCVDQTVDSSEKTDEVSESATAVQKDSLQILDLSVNPAVDYLLDYFFADGTILDVLVRQRKGRDAGQMHFSIFKCRQEHNYTLTLGKIFLKVDSEDIPCRAEVKRDGNMVKIFNPEDPEVGYYEINLVELVQLIRERLGKGNKSLSIPKKFVPGIREFYREEKTDQELRETIETIIPDNSRWKVGKGLERTVKHEDVLFAINLTSLFSGLFGDEMEVEVKYKDDRIEIRNPNEPLNCILALDFAELVEQLRKINKNPKQTIKANLLFKKELLETEQEEEVTDSQEIHPIITEVIDDVFVDGKTHELKAKAKISRSIVGRQILFLAGKIASKAESVLVSRNPEGEIKVINPNDIEVGHYESSVGKIAASIREKLLNGITSITVSLDFIKNPIPEFYRIEKSDKELEGILRNILPDGVPLKMNQQGNKIFGVEGVRITLSAGSLSSDMPKGQRMINVDYRDGKVVLSSIDGTRNYVLSNTVEELVSQLREANRDPSHPRFPSLNFEQDILDYRESIMVTFHDGNKFTPYHPMNSTSVHLSFCSRRVQIGMTKLFPHIQDEYLIRVENDGENVRFFNNDHPEYGYYDCRVEDFIDMLSDLLKLPKQVNRQFGDLKSVSQIDYRNLIEELLAEPKVLNVSDTGKIIFDIFRRQASLDAEPVIDSDNSEDVVCFLDEDRVVIRQGETYSQGAYICDIKALIANLEYAFSTVNQPLVNPFDYYSSEEIDEGVELPESTPFLREKGTQENGRNGSKNEQEEQTPLQKLRLLIAGAHSNPSLWDNEEFVAEYIRLYDLSQANIEHYYTNSLILDLYRQGKFDAFPDSVLSLGAGYFEELQAHHVGLREVYEREGIEVPKVYSLDMSENMLLMGADSLEQRYPELFPKDSIEMIQADMRQAVTAVDIYFNSFEEDTVVKFGMIECSSMDQINRDDNAAKRFARDICMLSRTGTIVKLVNREEISPTIIQELENEGFEVISKERDIVWLPDSEFKRIASIEGEERGRRIKEVLSNNFILIAVKKETLPTLKKVVKVMIGDTEDQFLVVEVIKRGDRIFTRVPTNIPLGLEDTVYAIENEVLDKITALQDIDAFFRTVTTD